MAGKLRKFTHEHFDMRQIESKPVPPGVIKSVGNRSVIYLHADNVDGRYEASAQCYSWGRPVQAEQSNPFCFDLTQDEGIIVCIRGMQVDGMGRPMHFIVETYQAKRAPVLRVVG